MILLPVFVIVASALVAYLVSTLRIALVATLIAAVVAWVLVSRLSYVTPMPVNEPEWWGGLVATCALAGVGVAIGAYMRRRARLSGD